MKRSTFSLYVSVAIVLIGWVLYQRAPRLSPNEAHLLRPHNFDPTQCLLPTKVDMHRPVTGEEIGNQRAKDLIDIADSEDDPKRAVALYEQALTFGTTGIQASKAYLGLAFHAEASSNIDQAVEYYTQSIEAWQPTPDKYFWRGRLLYQRGDWAQAKQDIDNALSLPSPYGLCSPELEEAQRYQAELEKLTINQ